MVNKKPNAKSGEKKRIKMKSYRKCIVLILVLTGLNCSYNRTLLKDNNKFVRNQITHLKKESVVFLAKPEQNSFEEELFHYLRQYKQYDFFNGRENPALLSPLIIDANKVLAFVAVRYHDNANQDVEGVKFISAKFENDRWVFGVKQGHGYSFSYADNSFPRLTNEKLAENTISNLMLEGFFKNNLNDKSLFESSWYVF